MIKDYRQLASDISGWLRNYLITNKLDCFIIGVSGGIDSAVVSTLCARTGIPTFAYGVPINSHPENNKNSELQLKFLKDNYPNVTTHIQDLSVSYNAFHNDVEMTPLTQANTKSRFRMVFLYSQAGNKNGLVVGTGNACEDIAIQFFTKYGDGGVDISPIGDLLKTQVWELGRFLKVPQEIINAKPTDGLHEDNRGDENQIGATYPELEEIMEYIENGEVGELNSRQKEVLAIYKHFNTKNKHKMLPIPIFKVDKTKYQ